MNSAKSCCFFRGGGVGCCGWCWLINLLIIYDYLIICTYSYSILLHSCSISGWIVVLGVQKTTNLKILCHEAVMKQPKLH